MAPPELVSVAKVVAAMAEVIPFFPQSETEEHDRLQHDIEAVCAVLRHGRCHSPRICFT